MALFHSRRVTPEKVVVFLLGGFGIGTVIGYIFMATAHTVRLSPPPPTRGDVCISLPAHLLDTLRPQQRLAATCAHTRGMRHVRTQMLEIRADSHYGVVPVSGQGTTTMTLTFPQFQFAANHSPAALAPSYDRCSDRIATAGAGCSVKLTCHST